MNISGIKGNLITAIEELPVWSVNGARTQWTIRCPFCGDSIKSLDHGHFSILIDPSEDVPILYHCFKCGEGGMFTEDVANMADIDLDDALRTSMRQFNRQLRKVNRYVDKHGNKPYVIPYFSQSADHQRKLDYISQRLGLTITYELAKELNIILDIFEFMQCNKIDSIPFMSFKHLAFLNYNYIGFLSSNKNQIINRCIVNNKGYERYYKVVIDPMNYSSNKYFNLPSKLDLMYTHPLDIHIAEGIIDILSVKLNLEHDDTPALYYAGCGFNYGSVIRYLIYNGINTDLHLHIYSDNDKTDKDHERYFMQQNVAPWLDHITIHRNQYPEEKDYGVPKEHIIDGIKAIR